VPFGPAGDATSVRAEVDDVRLEGGLVDACQRRESFRNQRNIVSKEPTLFPRSRGKSRYGDGRRRGDPLLLLPGSALLVPPARTGAGDPLLREYVADLRLPLGVAVGHGDLAVDGVAIAVVVGHRGIHRDAVLQ